MIKYLILFVIIGTLVYSNITTYNTYDNLLIEYSSLNNDYKELLGSYYLISDNLSWIKEGSYIKGYAFNNDYYCVVTAGRTVDDILGTDCHEKTHIVINKDYEHFCNKGVLK